MKIIDFFTGGVVKYDAEEFVSNYLQPDQVDSFKELMQNPRQNIFKLLSDYILNLDKELFANFFDGYTDKQVNYIYRNVDEIITLVHNQVGNSNNLDTSVFLNDWQEYYCNDCGREFTSELVINQTCEVCGGELKIK